jgi:hypothetical protein
VLRRLGDRRNAGEFFDDRDAEGAARYRRAPSREAPVLEDREPSPGRPEEDQRADLVFGLDIIKSTLYKLNAVQIADGIAGDEGNADVAFDLVQVESVEERVQAATAVDFFISAPVS